MPLPTRRVESALRAKGFAEDDSHHHYFVYCFESDGIVTEIRTKTSHGTSGSKKDVSDDLLGRMAKQCRLTKHEFEDLVKCPLSREAYERLLHERL